MNNNINVAAFHVLNLISRGVSTEKQIASELAADGEGRNILARDLRAPGRQIDVLERQGLIAFVGDTAVLTNKARATAFKVT